VHIAEALVLKLSSPYELRLVRDTGHGSSKKTVQGISLFTSSHDAHALKSYEALTDGDCCTISREHYKGCIAYCFSISHSWDSFI